MKNKLLVFAFIVIGLWLVTLAGVAAAPSQAAPLAQAWLANNDAPLSRMASSGPNLSIPTHIPVYAGQTVSVPVQFYGSSYSIAGTVFSVDFDQACLALDPADGDQDGTPDAIVFNVPGTFNPSVAFDANDAGGELDFIISDAFPPLAVLPDGVLVTIVLTATCQPPSGGNVIAPVGFSSDPAASFGNTSGQSVPGSATGGSVEILPEGAPIPTPSPTLTTTLTPTATSTITPTPTSTPAITPTPTITPTITPTPSPTPVVPGPELDIPANIPAYAGQLVSVPVSFSSNGHSIASILFSLDLDELCLAFDPADGDQDQIPDTIAFDLPGAFAAWASYNASDTDGELDFYIADTFPPLAILSDGILVTVTFTATCQPPPATSRIAPVIFSSAPAASFGSTSGQSVPGSTAGGSVEVLSSAVVTPVVDFSTASWTVNEGAGTATLAVTLSTASNSTVSVDYASRDLSAGSGLAPARAGDDYITASGRLTFLPGQITQTLDVAIVDDSLDEADEVLTLALSAPTHAVLGGNNPVTLTILDDDPAPRAEFAQAAYFAYERDGQAAITVTLDAASSLTITVDYTTGNGTAGSGDYTSVSGRLVFSPGVTSQVFSVPIVDDSLDESDETVSLALSNASHATSGSPATLYILDDDGQPGVRFSAAQYVASEAQGAATAVVMLSNASALTTTVDYATVDPSTGSGLVPATVGGDYTAVSGTLTFTPGTTVQILTIPISDDALDEGDEALAVTLSDPVNAQLSLPYTATLLILDDDLAPTIEFSQAAYSVNEDAGDIPITVTLSAPSGLTVTVDYTTNDDTATAGDDYAAASGQLNFRPGQLIQTLNVPILDDELDETDESLGLALSAPSNASLGSNGSTLVTILDNDPTPTVGFSAKSYSRDEGKGTATITVTLSAASSLLVTVDYATGGGTATTGRDYTAASSQLVFAPGQVTQTFEVPILDDSLDELDETVSLTLSHPVNAKLGSNALAVLTIVDDDPLPAIEFSDAAYLADESDGSVTITVALSATSGLTVTAEYATGDGTAIAGLSGDYITAGGVLTFAPGITTQTFRVLVNDDALDEQDEWLAFTLANAHNAVAGVSSRLTIRDDDGVPGVRFSAAEYAAGEAGRVATVTVMLSNASALTVTVDYATGDGTAEAGNDYAAISGTVMFTPGMTTQTLVVPINDDALDEDNESVLLSLSQPVNAQLSLPNLAVLTIVDDDPPPAVGFDRTAYSASEAAGSVPITITLSAPSGLTVTVEYATGGGTALAGSDYIASSGWISFTPGQTIQTWSVLIRDDSLNEPDETLGLTLSKPVNAALGGSSQATLTIVDDDATPLVAFDSASYSVDEGKGSATITVTLSAPSGLTATVDYFSSDLSIGSGLVPATAGPSGDYIAVSGRLSFAPGQTIQTLEVPIVNDSLDESDEALNLTLNNAGNASLGGDNTATLIILDNDPAPSIQFAHATYLVDEWQSSVTITVALSAASGLTVTAEYATSDGTAIAGLSGDYITAGGVLTFTPGITAQTFRVLVNDDALDEQDEWLALSLANAHNADAGDSSRLTIRDDDGVPGVRFSAAEYTTGEAQATASIPVLLGSASALTVTVDYATGDGTAEAGNDYAAISGTVMFTPGTTTQTLVVPINDDALDEDDESVLLSLSQPANAQLSLPNPAVLTIVDDDPPPAVGFDRTAYSASEAAGSVPITVTLSAPSGLTVTVEYATGNGTALAGSDYTTASGRLTFLPGQITQTLDVAIIDDSLDEADEVLTLALSNPTHAVLGDNNPVTLTIVDNDPAPRVEFAQAAYFAYERDGQAVVTVTLDAVSGLTITVEYATGGGTAGSGDYTSVSGRLVFSPGVTSQVFSVPIVDDSLDESDETVSLALSNASHATSGGPAMLYILDDDGQPGVRFSAAQYVASEAQEAAVVAVMLSNASALTATADYATVDNTATAGAPGPAGGDYTAVSGVLTFTPGTTIQIVTISINNDALDEDDETAILVLSDPVNALASLPYTATLVILDDDPTPIVEFSQAAYSVNEDAGDIPITVTLSAPSGLTVTVDYTTNDDTATAGDDYAAASGWLIFRPGQIVQAFDVSVVDDGLDENDETIVMALGNASNSLLGSKDTAVLTIIDKDPAPTLEFSRVGYTVEEGTSSAAITVALSTASGLTVTVDYTSRDGSARAGDDYITAIGRLIFPPGQIVHALSVHILDDSLDESDETVSLTLSNPSQAVLGDDVQATLTILDDDEPSPPGPHLNIPSGTLAYAGTSVAVPVYFTSHGHSIASIIFSIDFDQACLAFDPTDADGNNIPEAIAVKLPGGYSPFITFDGSDTDGELDFFISDVFTPMLSMPDGVFVTMTFTATCQPAQGTSIIAPLRFSSQPGVSFGNTQGQSVPGSASDGSVEIVSSSKPSIFYLPVVVRNFPPQPRPLIETPVPQIPAGPVLVQGETFFTTPLSLAGPIPADGWFYFSGDPHQVTPIVVDDRLALVRNGSEIFSYTFSIEGAPPMPAIVEVPRSVVEAIAGGGVILEYRDVYAVLISASEVWLIWSPEAVSKQP